MESSPFSFDVSLDDSGSGNAAPHPLPLPSILKHVSKYRGKTAALSPQQRRPGVQLPVLQRHDAVGRPGVVPNAAGV